MPFSNPSRLEFGNVLFDGKSKILEVVNTSKKGQKIDESMVVKQSPYSASSMNEIRYLSQLKHKSIIRYRGYEKQLKTHDGAEEKVIMFLERAHGGDLYDQLCLAGKFSEETARSLFTQMVDAVRFIHSQNIAHRDLKLENFLLMEKSNGEIDQLLKCHLKLADFEFACERTEAQPRRQDKAGTTSYLSPEQVQGDYCPMKSDVWALGVALYLMVCGKFPQFYTSPPSSPTSSGSSTSLGYRELQVPAELSPELRSLLKTILECEEGFRPSIEEVRKHNWTVGQVAKTTHRDRIMWPHFHLPIRIH